MKCKSNLIFSSRPSKNHKKIICTAFFIFLGFLCSVVFYLNFNYNHLFSSFKNDFNSNKFSSANNLLLTEQNFNPFKQIFLTQDLSDYFSDKLVDISYKLDTNEISKTDALNILFEIRRYNFTSIDTSEILKKIDYDDAYNYGISLYDSGRYIESYNVFSTISYSSSLYDSSLDYIERCKANIKADTLSKVEDFFKNNYYTKALDEIDSVKNIIGDDIDIKETISKLEAERTNFLAMKQGSSDDSLPASASVIKSVTPNNINSLSLSSGSNYLIHVDLTTQKTYVYTGSTNNWKLSKTFICSTGIAGEDTPEGSFSIQEKGIWFFSEQYKQGGKYWVQFSNNYLFHSLPFDETQKNIIDYTLGKPSSHGCIRLSESDSKWLYDNIPSGSKVIINKQS